MVADSVLGLLTTIGMALADESHSSERETTLDSERACLRPALSVVVLTYNSASTIEACLESLVNQDFTDFETIIVDDDSTDTTLSLISKYSSRLRLSVVQNGARNIPRGRNIGLRQSSADIVAFVDSDDAATRDWTQVIVSTFHSRPDLALISGPFVQIYRTKTSQAIGLNDAMVQRLAGRGIMRFCTANCAINRKLLKGDIFDEDFRAAEDLELISRAQRHYAWSSIPAMKVKHTSRDSLTQYSKQMYLYGFMKLYLGYRERSYRWIDFVPLALLIASVIAAAVLGSWWILFAILPFSFLEALVVVIAHRCRPVIAMLTFPAWVTKNMSWSVGVGHGILSLAVRPEIRRQLRSKRTD